MYAHCLDSVLKHLNHLGNGLFSVSDIDNCYNETCSGNGECKDIGYEYECECFNGFYGEDCESTYGSFVFEFFMCFPPELFTCRVGNY